MDADANANANADAYVDAEGSAYISSSGLRPGELKGLFACRILKRILFGLNISIHRNSTYIHIYSITTIQHMKRSRKNK